MKSHSGRQVPGRSHPRAERFVNEVNPEDGIPSDRLRGTVIRRVVARYFGFIRAEGDDRDEYFFHADDLENCDFGGLLEGDHVTFISKPSRKGLRAGEVRRV